ncbi:MAG: hypothetical protein AB9873_14345 [Syntrophobacteraceae bacterium]
MNSVAFMDFVATWIKAHIVGSDRLFGKYVQSGSIVSENGEIMEEGGES